MRGLFRALTTSFAALVCSASCYAGGSSLYPQMEGYSPDLNFLTDLARPVAHNGEVNLLSAWIFLFAFMTLIIVFGREVTALTLMYSSPAARGVGISASILAAFIGVAFAAVTAWPHLLDTNAWLYGLLVAGLVIPIVPLLCAEAALREPRLPRQAGIGWLLLAALSAIYQSVRVWGPAVSTIGGLRFQVGAQLVTTAVTVSVLMYVIWVTREALGVSDDTY